MAKLIYKVSIPHTYRDYYDYYATDLNPCLGGRVIVPFRNKERMGIIIGEEFKDNPHATTKEIIKIIDDKPLLTGEILALCSWVSSYYQSPLSEVIPLALPKKYRGLEDIPPPSSEFYSLKIDKLEAYTLLNSRSPRQRELLDYFVENINPLAKKIVLNEGFTKANLNSLEERGILLKSIEIEKPKLSTYRQKNSLALNPEQAVAVQTILAELHAYQAFLLQGVTGSGKTEVYLQVIENVLALGRQVLVLVPEIGLTPQLLARFSERFKEPMAVIHSRLNDSERQLAFHWAKEESVKLVIGTRAAIFTPMPALGLIVIDEEHDTSFKQMDGVRYSARDTALMRAHLRHIPIVLGSATPSLESLHNCALNKYKMLRLNFKALNSKPLHYEILDIRNQNLTHGLAPASLQAIKEHLEADNQVLVFINRRGFAPVLLCHSCGWMADCRGCDAHLTMHKAKGILVCHHCGLTQKIPTNCQSCKGHELLPVGAGTQRIHEHLQEAFKDRSVLRIDRDEIRKKDALDANLALINDGNAQLIVGTQMLAKGHHFPKLTLVIVLDTDNGFYNQDFRALEKLGQLLTQVSGRAGRAEFQGQVIIQTHVPNHPLLNLLIQQGYDAFAESLLATRKEAELPPYHYISMIRAEGKAIPPLLNFLNILKAQFHQHEIKALGPAPAPLSRKSGLHRMQLLIKSPSRKKLNLVLAKVREGLVLSKEGKGIRWNVDVDPMDLS